MRTCSGTQVAGPAAICQPCLSLSQTVSPAILERPRMAGHCACLLKDWTCGGHQTHWLSWVYPSHGQASIGSQEAIAQQDRRIVACRSTVRYGRSLEKVMVGGSNRRARNGGVHARKMNLEAALGYIPKPIRARMGLQRQGEARAKHVLTCP